MKPKRKSQVLIRSGYSSLPAITLMYSEGNFSAAKHHLLREGVLYYCSGQSCSASSSVGVQSRRLVITRARVYVRSFTHAHHLGLYNAPRVLQIKISSIMATEAMNALIFYTCIYYM